MNTAGIPETCTQRCGEEIARIRTLRKWSRSKLIARLYTELSEDDPTYDSISESWLKRLENGEIVKLPRQTIEALCRTLLCTPTERARILLYADRNILGAVDAPDEVALLLNEVIGDLHTAAADILADLIDQRRTADLARQEKLLLVAKALDLVLRVQRRSAS